MTKDNHNSKSNKKRIYLSDTTVERQFLRDVILYGCYNTRDYLDRQGLVRFLTSDRKDGNMIKGALTNEKHRLKSFLPAETLTQDEHGNYVCNYDAINGKDHPLLLSYCMRSCSVPFTSEFIQIQSYLNRKGPSKVTKILDDIGDQLEKKNEEISRPALKKFLNQLTTAGFLKHNGDVYQEADDILEGFSEYDLKRILCALDFAVNTSSFSAPYYFAWRKIRLYLVAKHYQKVLDKWKKKHKKGEQPPRMDYAWLNGQEIQFPYIDFPRKHIFSQLDQDQIYLILRAIHDHQYIKIELFNRDRYGSDETEIITKEVLPVHIREDAWTGRMLVQCVDSDPEYYTLHQYRIDYINRVETVMTKAKDDDPERPATDDILFAWASEAFREYQNYIWSTSEDIPISGNGFQKVKVLFHVSKDTQYVIDRVEREMLNGQGEYLDENTVAYVFEAIDPNDMSAWLRSFGESAEVVEPVSLRNKIRKQWKNAEDQMNDEKEFAIDQNENYFNGNDSRELADTTKRKDEDITIMPPYENIRNEVATAIWYTAYNQDGMLLPWQLNEMLAVLTPEGSPLREKLDIDELRLEGRTDVNHRGAGYLFKNGEGSYRKCWFLNRYIADHYGDMPIRLSALEQEGLIALLRQEEIYEPLLRKRIFKKLKAALGNHDMSWDPDDISLEQNWGSYAAGKPDWKKIRKLKTAIKRKKCISFCYEPVFSDKYDKSQTQQGYPVRLEYFPGGNRVRVVMYMREKGITRMMVERMSDIHEAPNPDKEMRDKKYGEYIRNKERQLIMKIKPVSFALERIVRLFSYYHKKMVYDPDTSIYTMTLTYLKPDEETVVRDILSCGDFVKVVGNPELRDKVLTRIQKAEKNYQ